MDTENLFDNINTTPQFSPERLAKIEKEKAELEDAIASGNYKTKKDKVAAILNLYPKTRNSDVALTIKFWEVFQGDTYTGGALDPTQLFKLERLTTIARIRAKIQNEYGLYVADATIRKRRRKLEENVKEVMASDNPSLPMINIFADETGKNSEYVVIGSVWIIDAVNMFKLYRRITEWKDLHQWKKEIHFTRCGKSDVEKFKLYVDLLADNREFIGFKFVAFNKVGSSRSIESAVINLYKLLILKGVEHELKSGRITYPRIINLTIDKEDSIDSIAIEELKLQVRAQLVISHKDNVRLNEVETLDSKDGPFIQIADLISGAINRKLNHKGDWGFKDDLAEYIFEKLGIKFGTTDNNDDSSVIIMI